jgi:hypothetical protein
MRCDFVVAVPPGSSAGVPCSNALYDSAVNDTEMNLEIL